MKNRLAPRMTKAELDLLDNFIPFGGNVLEFGSGGSTRHFFSKGISHLTSVDSDPAWLDKLSKDKMIQFFANKGKWQPIHADIGPLENWGKPVDKRPNYSWLSYHQCWDMIKDKRIQLILIDGRFRVACLCQSILNCKSNSTIFIVHDFEHRPYYQDMLTITDIIVQADSSVALKRKKRIDWHHMCHLIQKYQFDWR